jgi:exopolyphosphatase/guanosine-5'-triphosphate,3'-diphosphate pyrophosphatase
MIPDSEEVVAFIDIGTNSIRLLVVRMNAGGGYSVLSEQKEVVRLGEGEFPGDQLSKAAMDRAVLVCRTFVDLARSFGATEFEAVATSATREARNKQVFLNRLATEADLPVRVIAGREEARLIYLGIRSGIDLGDQTALFIDIGGGSTELSVGTGSGYKALYSLNLGSIRLSSLFPPKDKRGTMTQKEYGKIRDHILEEGGRVILELKDYPITRVFGSSGTLLNLAEIAARMFHSQEQNVSQVLVYTDLVKVAARLCSLSVEERRKIPGINPERADIIVPGAAIIETLMQTLGLSEITITNRGLRDGLLVDSMEQRQTLGGHSVRQQSITSLGEACRINHVHAIHIQDLADDLFLSSREVGVHSFGSFEEELLGHAAYLHDIGSFVSFTNHQVHSQYLIANADLLGFDQQEILIIASIAGLHRKKVQVARGRVPSGLEPQYLRTVQVLGALLRLAESLDRTHIGLVRTARFQRSGEKGLTLRITCRGDCHLEIWGVEREKRTVQKVLGERLRIEVVRERDGSRD